MAGVAGVEPMRVVSWNVNGIRACVRHGLVDFLGRSGADIVGVQEVRALPEEIPPAARTPAGWHAAFSVAERRGYSGVGIYSKFEPYRVETSLGEPRFDVEGRFIAAHFRTDRGRFAVVNGYFPKGSGKDRDNSRVGYKLAFYRAVFDRAQLMRRHGAIDADHLDYYLDEFTFRFNRRRSQARGLLFFRLLQQAVQHEPVPYKGLVPGARYGGLQHGAPRDRPCPPEIQRQE